MNEQNKARHRNWDNEAPAKTGIYYFSGTLGIGPVAFSFEPNSVLVTVIQGDDGGLVGFLHERVFEFAEMRGRWLGPMSASEVMQYGPDGRG